jgi:hypothetical protein
MALRNLASYKVGKSYKFDFGNGQILNAKVLEKGYKKLRLEKFGVPSGLEDWFSNEVLSLPKVYPKLASTLVRQMGREVDKRVMVNVNAKPLSKLAVEYDIKKDKNIASLLPIRRESIDIDNEEKLIATITYDFKNQEVIIEREDEKGKIYKQ